VTKAETQALHQHLSKAKDYDDLKDVMGTTLGQDDFQQIVKSIEERSPRGHRMILDTTETNTNLAVEDEKSEQLIVTPEGTQNPEPPTLNAPFLPNDPGKALIDVLGRDATTPTPTGNVTHASI